MTTTRQAKGPGGGSGDGDAGASRPAVRNEALLGGLAALQREVVARWGSSAYAARHLARGSLGRADHDTKHLATALGKVARVVGACDHEDLCEELRGLLVPDEVPTPLQVERYLSDALADLVIVAADVAANSPFGPLPLELIVQHRIAAKFPPAVASAAPPPSRHRRGGR